MDLINKLKYKNYHHKKQIQEIIHKKLKYV